MPPEEQDNRILLIIVAIMAAIGLFCLFAALGTGAWAHEATTTAAKPQGWAYPLSCRSNKSQGARSRNKVRYAGAE